MILVNNPGSWAHLYGPLAHAPWHGWTLTDLVFPFFLFAVGNALAMAPDAAVGRLADPFFWRRWLRRALVIFGLGLLLNAWPFLRYDGSGALQFKELESLRFMGVLQRIALCWACAALVLRLVGVRGAWSVAAVLLLGYWAACIVWAQGADPYSLEGFFGTALDRAWLGASHLYQGEGVPFDPEGLASTLPAVAQVLLGFLAGDAWRKRASDAAGWRWLIAFGAAAVLLAALWQGVMPINKKLWTSSYVLLTTGLAALALVALGWAMSRASARRRPFSALTSVCEAFGRNALLVFVLSGLVPRTLGLLRIPDGVGEAGEPKWLTPTAWLYRDGLLPHFTDPRAASLAYALATLAFYAAIAIWLHRRRWYFTA
jgi:predicted acyltransferase